MGIIWCPGHFSMPISFSSIFGVVLLAYFNIRFWGRTFLKVVNCVLVHCVPSSLATGAAGLLFFKEYRHRTSFSKSHLKDYEMYSSFLTQGDCRRSYRIGKPVPTKALNTHQNIISKGHCPGAIWLRRLRFVGQYNEKSAILGHILMHTFIPYEGYLRKIQMIHSFFFYI